MIEHLLNTTVDIYRVSESTSNYSTASTFSLLTANVKARVQPVSSSENVRAGRQASVPTFRVYVVPATDVTMVDRVSYGGNMYDINELNVYPDTYTELVMSKV